MIGVLRRLVCRLGRHHVLRCAGSPDHYWTWTAGRWTAQVDRPRPPLTPVRPAVVSPDARAAAVAAAPIPKPRHRA